MPHLDKAPCSYLKDAYGILFRRQPEEDLKEWQVASAVLNAWNGPKFDDSPEYQRTAKIVLAKVVAQEIDFLCEDLAKEMTDRALALLSEYDPRIAGQDIGEGDIVRLMNEYMAVPA